jgi:hypothetical protein
MTHEHGGRRHPHMHTDALDDEELEQIRWVLFSGLIGVQLNDVVVDMRTSAL